jgi:conjugal transfer pilus assembly protein TraW
MKKLIAFLLLLSVNVSYGHLIGSYGTSYPITEPDFLKFIMQKLQYLKKTGQMQKMQQQMIERVQKHAVTPIPVDGLTTTKEPKKWTYDPTYVLTQNITDEKGKVLFKAGTTVNPFEKLPAFNKELLFFNADDPRQVTWANDMIDQFKGQVTPVLVQGNLKKAFKEIKVRLYFDTDGLLSKRFQLSHIPAAIYKTPHANTLTIQEYSASDYLPYKKGVSDE